MPLVIVNPTHRSTVRRRRRTSAPKAKRRSPMAKRRRSAAQKRAFHRMITANPHRRRRRRVVSNPIRHVRRRRTVHMNPHRSYRHARRHRNPGGGFLSSLFDKQGLMLLGAVVATPTIMSEGQSMLAPSATGYYQAGIQGAIGVGLGWAAYKFLDRQVGVVMAAVGIGTAVAQLINGYNAGTLSNSVLNGYPVAPPVVGKFQVRNTLGSREAGARTLSGYTGAGVGGRACSVMSGYTNTLARIPEPGARRIR